MEKENEANSTDEIEVTEEMVMAAAQVLWAEDVLALTDGWAWDLAKRMLERAAAAYRDRRRVSDPEVA